MLWWGVDMTHSTASPNYATEKEREREKDRERGNKQIIKTKSNSIRQ